MRTETFQTPGKVRTELRLGAGEIRLTSGEEAEAAPVAGAAEGFTARISLRLPDTLKTSVEAAAAREGVSVNTWIVRALSRSAAGPAVQSGNRLTGYARS